MSSNPNLPTADDPLVHSLSNLSAEFSECFDRSPTATEFAGVLAEGAKWARDELFRDLNGINLDSFEMHVQTKVPAERAVFPEISMADLPDAVLTASCNALSGASARLQEATGERPTATEFCQILTSAIRHCPKTLLADFSPEQIVEISAHVKKRGKVALRPGDIVSIPAEKEPGRFYLACVLVKNRFGTAYGFFRGSLLPTGLAALHRATVSPHPIYSGEQCVAKGQWSVVAHDEKLLSAFPAEPEIFHRPSSQAPFGLAETAAGSTRQLSKEEATSVGLLDGSYRQTYTCEFLAKRLPQIL